MKNIQYELTCPHCGLKYSYDMGAGDPAENSLPMRCGRCGQSEPIKDYYRMNCIPSAQVQGMHTVMNHRVKDLTFDRLEFNHNIVRMEPQDQNTVLMKKPVMTQINIDNDPHVFRNPATLINPHSGERLTMSLGEQTVGRWAEVTPPDKGFHEVPRTVSRHHVCITTVECGNGRYVNMVMNRKNMNQTLLDGKELPSGAIWKLGKGMKLTMGELTVIVEDM